MISTAPKPTVTVSKSLPPTTDAQGALPFIVPDIDVSIQGLCDLDLGHLHPLAPIDMDVDWNAPSGLFFPSVDHLATRTSNEGREVKVP